MSEEEIEVVVTVCQAVAPKTPERVPCWPHESIQVGCFDCKAKMWMHQEQVEIVLKAKPAVVGICTDCYRQKKANDDVLAERRVLRSAPARWTTPN